MIETNPQALPKTLQVSEMLIREIVSGRIPDGSRLPSERQMAADLGIAVGTLRRALAILEDKGLLNRIQGSGNYVQAKASVPSVYSFFRLELLDGGGLPTADIIDVFRLIKPDGMPFIGEGKFAHRIRRLRFLNDRPVALEEIWLDGRFSGRLSADALSDSLYYFYKEKLRLIIGRVEDSVSVGSVPEWAPEKFTPQTGQSCGYFERTSFGQDGQAAEFSRNWFDHSVARYRVRL